MARATSIGPSGRWSANCSTTRSVSTLAHSWQPWGRYSCDPGRGHTSKYRRTAGLVSAGPCGRDLVAALIFLRAVSTSSERPPRGSRLSTWNRRRSAQRKVRDRAASHFRSRRVCRSSTLPTRERWRVPDKSHRRSPGHPTRRSAALLSLPALVRPVARAVARWTRSALFRHRRDCRPSAHGRGRVPDVLNVSLVVCEDAHRRGTETLPLGTPVWKIGRDDWIRTSDPLTPSQVRYQAAPHPDASHFKDECSASGAVSFCPVALTGAGRLLSPTCCRLFPLP